MKEFLNAHWGDLLALYILHLGIGLVVFYHADSDVAHIGESLVLAGMATMRFRGIIEPKNNATNSAHS